MIEGVRSLRRGQVTEAEARAAVRLFHEPHKAKAVDGALDDIEDYETDVLVADGDLHVPGDLDLTDEGAYLLIVHGDLIVDGCYGDGDDPESFLLVTGGMRARDVVTAGWLEVHGDLRTGRLIGDYNDCSALIGGDVHADLFYGEEHWFTVEGRVHANVVVGTPRMSANRPAGLPLDDVRLLDHFDRDLLRVLDDTAEDGTPLVDVDGFRDFHALKRRVRAGLPLRPP
ncbi:hypothetical protein EDD29_4465 [Actinocorallia herbida]|uniref:Polymer-forming protein n=1 Tax=Actinocorallia herbida TaxID=58109 RepID=A0A3N1D021_9ACTN|nr:hypothetical protein [Actinocorallia herbida]ROO86883.1 hypothetical protein EDD29_4465 [Actinocorallia herbida]